MIIVERSYNIMIQIDLHKTQLTRSSTSNETVTHSLLSWEGTFQPTNIPPPDLSRVSIHFILKICVSVSFFYQYSTKILACINYTAEVTNDMSNLDQK